MDEKLEEWINDYWEVEVMLDELETVVRLRLGTYDSNDVIHWYDTIPFKPWKH